MISTNQMQKANRDIFIVNKFKMLTEDKKKIQL